MKPRNREINIFNLSMLDVISGALGAFLIIMITLFPYYKKEVIDFQEQVEQLEQEIQSMQQQIDEAQEVSRQLSESQQQLGEAQRQLAKTFLVIYIRWATQKQDIDLHVIDPSGAEFWYKKKIINGRPGELSEDSTSGPGNEVWEIFNAPPGDYRIYAKLYSTHGNNKPPTIKGRVIHRDGSQRLPEIRLTSSAKTFITTITIKNNGDVHIRR